MGGNVLKTVMASEQRKKGAFRSSCEVDEEEGVEPLVLLSRITNIPDMCSKYFGGGDDEGGGLPVKASHRLCFCQK